MVRSQRHGSQTVNSWRSAPLMVSSLTGLAGTACYRASGCGLAERADKPREAEDVGSHSEPDHGSPYARGKVQAAHVQRVHGQLLAVCPDARPTPRAYLAGSSGIRATR